MLQNEPQKPFVVIVRTTHKYFPIMLVSIKRNKVIATLSFACSLLNQLYDLVNKTKPLGKIFSLNTGALQFVSYHCSFSTKLHICVYSALP